MTEEIRKILDEAEMILVGIGTECGLSRHSREELADFYGELAGILQGKPYFVVTLNTDDLIWDSPLEEEQAVAPCGSDRTGNVVSNENYDESWYLPKWQSYTKWIQNTLHRRLAVLELGVGMEYPGVIRWPFEKTAYFNKKAVLVRVHSRLFQIPAELGERGIPVEADPVEFLGKGADR
ncbi:MAG TPA: hypothetical protein IAB44_09315 [Candidatus Limivivens intestinipullorum]|uniref:Uncharacterized protein n=1 Tax=Candidatus Limivivens intestinipullorum TaxID=2840858 RepID=A0A9D1JK01_9FIRM|nr:hypothetical protein [Candidatus Limivivens intestinipullorum]